MQPPPATPPERHESADVLYRRHHHELQHAVAVVVRAPRELIEDACQTAWAIMLRAQPDRHSVFGWLRAVAIHEAYRLIAVEHREATLAHLQPRTEEPLRMADQPSLDDAVEALEALRLLAALPKRQRTDLALKIGGYTYKEIQACTPGRTMTSVNKSLCKARARIGRWR
jgi:DNA-directed RNA polymerase specialized sigma24 family protein